MGMYDEVKLECELPDGYQSDDIYQTKALDCTLTEYKIDKSGKLWKITTGWFDGEPLKEPILIEDIHLDMFLLGPNRRYVVRFTDGKVSRIKLIPEP